MRWLLFKCIAVLLMLSVMGLYCPNISFCSELGPFAKADQKTITRHEPKIMSGPEKEIPVAAAAKTAKRNKTPWLLIGLGAVAVVGLAAIAAGSGGSGGDSGPSAQEAGDVTVTW